MTGTEAAAPPRVSPRPFSHKTAFGDRPDEFHWLQGKDDGGSGQGDQEALKQYLKEENQHTETVMQTFCPEELEDALVHDMSARVPQLERSAPHLGQGGHWYYSRRCPGDGYWTMCRQQRLGGQEGGPVQQGPPEDKGPLHFDVHDESVKEVVVFDENAEASGRVLLEVGCTSVSPDGDLIAYTLDFKGDERYTLCVREVASGELLLASGEVENCAASVYWGASPTGVACPVLFFLKLTPRTREAYQLLCLEVPTQARPQGHMHTRSSAAVQPAEQPTVILTEYKEGDTIEVSTTRSGEYLVVRDSYGIALLSSSFRPGQEPAWINIAPDNDTRDFLRCDHWHDVLFLVSDTDDSPDGELVAASISTVQGCPASADGGGDGRGRGSRVRKAEEVPNIVVVMPGQDKTEILDFVVSELYLAVSTTARLAAAIVVYRLPPTKGPESCGSRMLDRLRGLSPLWSLDFPVGVPRVSLNHSHGPFDWDVLRLSYSTMTQPVVTEDINMGSKRRVVKQVEEVLGGYEKSNYVDQTLWVSSHDGTLVPVSIGYRRDLFKKDGSAPCLLQGYGAYGHRTLPSFNPMDLTLLDRGFVIAIAHIRGGGELGASWHLGGKKLKKTNTFKDFVAVAQHLISEQYSSAAGLIAWGRSAGGLTVGAALHMAPSLFKAAILDVPFVDPLTAMSDPDLPLTVKEWPEIGNPIDSLEVYEYMCAYSPYEQLGALITPNLNPDKPGVNPETSGLNPEPSGLNPETTDIDGGATATHPGTGGLNPESSGLSPDGRATGPALPHLLVTAGLNDPRVPVWQAAKYVARARHLMAGSGSTEERLLLLLTNMHGGHGSTSGAQGRLSERAQKYAFMLHALEH